jgi:hypothetical protein
VFFIPSPRTAQKGTKNNSTKRRFWIFVDFFGKSFRHGLFAKKITVFLNSPYRKTPKNVVKTNVKTFFWGVGWFRNLIKYTLFFEGPFEFALGTWAAPNGQWARKIRPWGTPLLAPSTGAAEPGACLHI